LRAAAERATVRSSARPPALLAAPVDPSEADVTRLSPLALPSPAGARPGVAARAAAAMPLGGAVGGAAPASEPRVRTHEWPSALEAARPAAAPQWVEPRPEGASTPDHTLDWPAVEPPPSSGPEADRLSAWPSAVGHESPALAAAEAAGASWAAPAVPAEGGAAAGGRGGAGRAPERPAATGARPSPAPARGVDRTLKLPAVVEPPRPEPELTVVRATELVKAYGRGAGAVEVLRGVSLAVPSGGLTLVMGPSGSGKTTLLSVLTGLSRPDEGSVELCGEPLASYDEARAAAARARHVGFVFPGHNLFPALRALDNVALALTARGAALGEARERAREALERVGLGARAGHRPGALSGGERQRVAVARALVGSPTLLVGDEVTAALDTDGAFRVMEMLRNYVTPRTAVLLVTHDRRLETFADRVIEVADGRVRRDRALSPRRRP
jgi:putative ABC transport system ATP-binding protein